MYRIVASDMDGTFLTEAHELPQANIDAVMRLRKMGVLFVPSSGRQFPSILKTLKDLPDEALTGSYIISYNGGTVHQAGKPEPLFTNTLPFEVVERIFDWGLPEDVGYHIYAADGRMWGHRLNHYEVAYLQDSMDWEPLGADSVESLRDIPIAKILYVHQGLEFLEELRSRLPEEMYAGTDTTISSRRYLEFNPSGVNKGTGITWLAQHLGIGLDEIIGCGDALNDLEMLQTVGCGVAAANATDDILAVADYRADASCEDGLIAEVLRELVEPSHAKA